MTACLLLATSPAGAQSVCLEAFTKWVKTSEATFQTQRKLNAAPGQPGAESCLPSEAARKSLQRSLNGVRRQCDTAEGAQDYKTTKPLIEINADVLATAPVCGPPLEVAAPAAPPPPLPKPPAQQPQASARPDVPAKPAPPATDAGRDFDPNSCLSMGMEGTIYAIENTLCPGARVITVVEIRLASGVRKCRGHVVTALTKLGTAKPIINYECIDNGADCTVKTVKGMFPYCTW